MTAEAQGKGNISWFASWPPPDGISRYAGSYTEKLTFPADINCSLNQQGEAQLRGVELLVYWSKSEAKLKCIWKYLFKSNLNVPLVLRDIKWSQSKLMSNFFPLPPLFPPGQCFSVQP